MKIKVDKLRRRALASLLRRIPSGSHSARSRLRSKRINALRGHRRTSSDGALKIDPKQVTFLALLSIRPADIKVTCRERGGTRQEGRCDGRDGRRRMQMGCVQARGRVAAQGKGAVGIGDKCGQRAA